MNKIILQNYLCFVLISILMVYGNVRADNNTSGKSEIAIFAGGCFWCMESSFDALPGVIKTVSGFTGGQVENPTYKQVSNGKTGHFEAVEVTYDPTKVSYEKLLDVFWHNIDPFDHEGQFCDKGDQYRAAIFYQDEKEKQLAETSKITIQKTLNNDNLTTLIKSAGKFYAAEDYHQDYHRKNPLTYKFYRFTCGRDHRLGQIWD
jgi:peptide-methionine (S)-S-oxide reductase